MHEVGYEVHVALGSSPTTLGTEWLLIGKPDEEQTEVMCQHVVGGVKYASTLLKIVVVSVVTSTQWKKKSLHELMRELWWTDSPWNVTWELWILNLIERMESDITTQKAVLLELPLDPRVAWVHCIWCWHSAALHSPTHPCYEPTYSKNTVPNRLINFNGPAHMIIIT